MSCRRSDFAENRCASQAFGIQVDEAANEACVGQEGVISTADSAIKVMVIPTDEELSIAQQTLEVVSS